MGLTNFPDGIETTALTVAGTAVAGAVSTLAVGTVDAVSLLLNGTAVTTNADELNLLDGQTLKYAAGTLTKGTAALVSGTVSTGLSTIVGVSATPSTATMGTGFAFCSVAPGAAGTVVISGWISANAPATTSGTIYYTAMGT